MKMRLSIVTVMAVVLGMVAGSANAADLYRDIGDGTWDNGVDVEWGTTTGAPYTDAAWNNATPDSATFEGTAGTVTLGTGITVADMLFTSGSGYTVSGNTLTFAAGSTLTNSIANVNHTFTCPIAGSPDVAIEDGTSQTLGFTFAPTSGSQVLGTCTLPYDNGGGDKCGLTLAGTTTGNSVSLLQFTGGQRWGKAWKQGSGTWTVGAANLGYFDIEAGVLIATGSINMNWSSALSLEGGELHYNNTAAVTGSKGWQISGGSVDNSSGAAIVSSTSPNQTWSGDWTFIGSSGALSDLTLSGTTTLSGGDRQITVQNAAATLTINGAIGDGGNAYTLTKVGAGTLALAGANTYSGETIINAGTLSISQAYLSGNDAVRIAAGAALDLNFSVTNDVLAVHTNGTEGPTGTWGAVGSGADNETTLITGTGMLNVQVPVALEGIRYWDGGSVDIATTGNATSDGGAGTWNTSIKNWDAGAGVIHTNWPNTTNDMAVLSGSAGTVTLGSDATLRALLFDSTGDYTISGSQSLNFGPGGWITNSVQNVDPIITTAISGSPSVGIADGGTSNEGLTFAPTSGNQILGLCTIPYNDADGGDKCRMTIGGTTTGNTIAKIQKQHNYANVYKEGTGTWTLLGDVDVGSIYLQAGRLVLNGTFTKYYQGMVFNGGTLAGTGAIGNMAVTVPVGGTIAPGDTTGTLTVDNGNNCTINGTLEIAIDDGASPKNGTLAVDGTLDINAATLDFSVTGAAAQPTYVIATHGTRSGKFAATNNMPTGYEITYGASSITISPESTPPTPSPMTWSAVPAGLSPSKINMTATTATDASGGIEYYFENTTNSDTSGWISLTTWTNSGLASVTTYGYRVKARDLFGNETGWSTPDVEATTPAADLTPPTPSTMTFAVAPAAESATAIVMTATTAADPSTPIEYFFLNTSNAVDSGWITSTIWTNTGLSAETTYGYTVKARDAASNTNTASAEAKATTPENTPPTPSPMVFEIAPASLDATRIVMTATNATDPSGPVEYYFVNTTNLSNSGWISTTMWTNTGLTEGTLYGYQVKARDALGNETVLSTEAFATPAPETTPPNPDPMTFAVSPAQSGADAIAMTATTATDALTPPVEYYFLNTNNSDNSGWISLTTWTNTGLPTDVTYGYQVKARDAISNETAYSSIESVLLPRPAITVFFDGPNTGGTGDGASAGGNGSWSTTVTNWDEGVSARLAWYNGSDTAIIGGANGTATLTENISLGNLRFTAGTHTVSGFALNFAAGGTITTEVNNVDQTITPAISGSPDVAVASNTSQDKGLKFAPTSGSQVLGVITMAYEDGSGDKCAVTLAGSTTGNTVEEVTFAAGHRWANLRKDGSGTWTVGDIDNGTVEILNGDFIATGTIYTRYRGIELKGGTLHCNTAGTVQAGAFKIQGGDLDNSSGSPITTSTYNPAQSWNSDFTFIGSNGANSDLNLGTGAATMSASRQVTVQNAAATLTVGGVISGGGRSLTKAGAGTLRLTGNNTYSGNTTVGAGTLSITQAYLADDGQVFISAGATLDLDFTGTDSVHAIILGGTTAAAGTWGRIGHPTADNTTSQITGDGLLQSAGVAYSYWDGPTTGGTGDGASAGGAGTWSTSTDNWDQGPGSRVVWGNTTNDVGIFGGSAGAVTLGEDLTVGEIRFTTSSEGYDITGNTLNFGAGGVIDQAIQHKNQTISSAITGSPEVRIINNSGANYKGLIFAPTSGSQTLGLAMVPYHDTTQTGDKGGLTLSGTTTGNSVEEVDYEGGDKYANLNKQGSGTWTVGKIHIGTVRLSAGTLIANGDVDTDYQHFVFTGGTLSGTGTVNDAISVPASGSIMPGDSTGTLTVNSATLGSGTLDTVIDDGQTPKNGTLASVGALTITGSTLDFSVTGSAAQSVYIIASYGSLTGTFGTINNLPTGYSVDYNYLSGNQIAIVAETTAPTPDPMTWASVPAALSPSKIGMTASTASDASGGIEYYFENTSNANTSGWIPLSTWTNSGLAGTTTYGYRVKARDLFGNETGWSTPDAEATTLAADSTAPTPDPMTFAVAPAAPAATEVVMTASTASDPSTPIQYYFENTTNNNNSGWQSSTVWTNSGLTAETTYGYRVKARDAALNETGWSTPDAEVTTPENTPPTPDPMQFEVLPASLDATRVVMTATNATDPSGPVSYYFENTTNSANSGWQSSTVWTNTGLTLGTLYGYRVKARDALGNETSYSTEVFATPANETTPPNPDPMTFAVSPAQSGADAIAMTATTATDALTPPVEYYFLNTNNSDNSGWISLTTWTNTGLPTDVTYGYQVKARDALSNETAYSSIESVLLPRPPITAYWDGANYGSTGDGASAGGTAIWSTSVTNWDEGVSARLPWYQGSDTAILGGSVGTVTLGENVSLRHLRFTASANNYTVTGNTLNFGSGGSITQSVKSIRHTITSAITGSPDVGVINGSGYEGLTFAPSSGSQTLGTLTIPYDDPVGGDKAGIHLAGTTTGNSVGEVTFGGGDRYGTLYKDDTGTWTVGNVHVGTIRINGGVLVANGYLRYRYAGLLLNSGGTLHCNNAGAIYSAITIAGGASLDNSSGAAISTSTYNPTLAWNGDWTFIGVNGANSDLNLGTGAATMNASRQVTVQNAAATLTVGGIVGDGGNAYTLTKAGAGTLALTGANTYSGETIINAGTLSISQAYLSGDDAVRIAAGATLDLNFGVTNDVLAVHTNGTEGPTGTWGAVGSGADNETTLITGTGMLRVEVPVALVGIRYWDGGSVDIAAVGDASSDGGAGTWNTSIRNWDAGAGVVHTNWPNTTNDVAVLGGTAGAVTLGADATLGGLLFESTGDYTISGSQSLNFGPGGWITNSVQNSDPIITTAISGSPSVGIADGGTSNEGLTFAPTSGNQILGLCTIPYNDADGGDKCRLTLGGTTTGNTIARIQKHHNYANVYKEGTGTWTLLGDVDVGSIYLQAGRLVLNGTFTKYYQGMVLNGGTLAGTGTIDNMSVTVPVGGTIAPGDTTGTLTIDNGNNCTINGTLRATIDGGVGTLAVDNTLSIGSATLDVNITGSASGDQVIATYGTLNGGAFAATNNLPTGWVVDYTYSGGTAIALLPPPTTFMFK